jgi:hypothetical protein
MTEKLVRDSSEPGYRNNHCVYIRSSLCTRHYALYTIFFLIKTKLNSNKMSNNISDPFNTETKLFLYKDWPE